MSFLMSWTGLIALLGLFGIAVVLPSYLIAHLLFPNRTRRKDTPDWRCHKCGYDLRNIDSPMCPECGVVRLKPAPRRKNSTTRSV